MFKISVEIIANIFFILCLFWFYVWCKKENNESFSLKKIVLCSSLIIFIALVIELVLFNTVGENTKKERMQKAIEYNINEKELKILDLIAVYDYSSMLAKTEDEILFKYGEIYKLKGTKTKVYKVCKDLKYNVEECNRVSIFDNKIENENVKLIEIK